MSGKKMFYFCILLLVVVVTYAGWKLTARSAYESAEYTVLESESPYEVREYPDLMMATTNMKFDVQGEDGSFMRLFSYISGANDSEQKVAMTTPVFMESAPSDQHGQMGFVIPREVTERSVPEPSNDSVQIQRRDGGRFAVIRFAGRMSNNTAAKAEQDLRAWITKKGLISVGDIEFAGYDPPWTPGPLRRNEVLLRLE